MKNLGFKEEGFRSQNYTPVRKSKVNENTIKTSGKSLRITYGGKWLQQKDGKQLS